MVLRHSDNGEEKKAGKVCIGVWEKRRVLVLELN